MIDGVVVKLLILGHIGRTASEAKATVQYRWTTQMI